MMPQTWKYDVIQHKIKNLKRVGKGAFGEVYDMCDGFVVKRIQYKDINKFNLRSTMREIILSKYMNHEHISSITNIPAPKDAKQFEKHGCFFIMKKGGSDLSSRMESDKPIDEKQIRKWMSGILQGVSYLHSNGIAHRDLKPANILLPLEEGGAIKICDFGLSKVLNTVKPSKEYHTDHKGKRRNSVYVGTSAYISPEMIRGKIKETINKDDDDEEIGGYGRSVDLWAIGCIMAEMYAHRIAASMGNTKGRDPIFPGVDSEELEGLIKKSGKVDKMFGEVARKLHKLKKTSSEEKRRSMIHEIIVEASCGSGKKEKKAAKKSTSAKQLKDSQALKLIEQLLRVDPNSRITASAALQDKFFNGEDIIILDEKIDELEDVENIISEMFRSYLDSSSDTVYQLDNDCIGDLLLKAIKYVETK